MKTLAIMETQASDPLSPELPLKMHAYPVGVERGILMRSTAVERTLTTLRFFWNSPQGPEPDATGYQGFYYHFFACSLADRPRLEPAAAV